MRTYRVTLIDARRSERMGFVHCADHSDPEEIAASVLAAHPDAVAVAIHEGERLVLEAARKSAPTALRS